MAVKSLGVLTLDLVARTGGFVQGMSKAERSAGKWRKQVEKDLVRVGKAFGATAAAAAAGVGVLAASAASTSKDGPGPRGRDPEHHGRRPERVGIRLRGHGRRRWQGPRHLQGLERQSGRLAPVAARRPTSSSSSA